jgi:hypothetical protein
VRKGRHHYHPDRAVQPNDACSNLCVSQGFHFCAPDHTPGLLVLGLASHTELSTVRFRKMRLPRPCPGIGTDAGASASTLSGRRFACLCLSIRLLAQTSGDPPPPLVYCRQWLRDGESLSRRPRAHPNSIPVSLQPVLEFGFMRCEKGLATPGF